MSPHKEDLQIVNFEGHSYHVLTGVEVREKLEKGEFHPSEENRYWIDTLQLGYSRAEILEREGTVEDHKIWTVPINLNYCRIGDLSAYGTTFEEPFEARHAIIEEHLNLGCFEQNNTPCTSGTIFKKEVHLDFIRVNAQSSFKRATFGEELTLNSSQFMELVDFSDCVFKGKVNLVRGQVDGKLRFKRCHFHEKTNFSRSSITGIFSLEDAIFEKELFLDKVFTQNKLSFQNTKLKDCLKIERGEINGDLDFRGAEIQDLITLNSRFNGVVTFSENTNTMKFREENEPKKFKPIDYIAVIKGKALFANTFFYRKTIFEFVHFQGEVDFRNTYFAELVSFRDAKFYEEADFTFCYCATELDFMDCIFSKNLKLDNSNINRKLNLTNATLKAGISFSKAIIDVLMVERKQIEGKLIYQGLQKEHEKNIHFEKLRSEFLILKESYHQLGRYDEEDWCYHMFKRYQRKDLLRSAYRTLSGEKYSMNQATLYQKEGLTHPLQDIPSEEYEKTFGEGSSKYMPSQPKPRNNPTTKLTALLRILIKPFEALFVDLGTSYGTHPFRIAFLTLGIALFYTFLYWGWHHSVLLNDPTNIDALPIIFEGREYQTNAENQIVTNISGGDFFVFSMMMFVAGGMESAHPSSESFMKYICMSESFIGVFIMALFVGCYIRKVLR